ncbi:TetR/AcrR family transcriptional regulator [Streptomyces sp. NPDC058206]|uniref:TetR/AcrR family transcriptional regulator n=1 Tax=Streptomyces sp. NPDC058206 TaxID=3346382 RepID=UPI0036E5922C
MRKLATALDANPMSLYHHVPNKDAVLRGVAARVGSQCREGQREDIPWQDRMRQLALDFRALAHRHPKLMECSFARADYVQPEDPFWRGLTDTSGRSIHRPECRPRARASRRYRGTALPKVDQHDTDGVHDCLVTDRPGCLRVLAQPSCFGFLLFIAVLLAAGGIANLLS